MAEAPTPGVGAREAAADNAERVMKITLRGDEFTLAPNLLSMNEKLAVRKATGVPFEAFWADEEHLGEDSFAVLTWLALRANGHAGLGWATFLADHWPNDPKPGDFLLDMIEPAEVDAAAKAGDPEV